MRIGVLTILGFALLAALASTSCSDDPPAAAPAGDAGPDAPPPLTDEASTFVTDFCALNEPCCASLTGAGTKCLTETGSFARGKAFDSAKAKLCLDNLRTESKRVKFCGQGPEMITCAAVFKNADPKPPGEACTTSAECASSAD